MRYLKWWFLAGVLGLLLSVGAITVAAPPNHRPSLPVVSITVKDLKQDKVNPLIRKFSDNQVDEDANYFISIRPLNMRFYAIASYDGKGLQITLMAMEDYPTFGLKAGDKIDAKDLWPKIHKFATTGNRFQGPG